MDLLFARSGRRRPGPAGRRSTDPSKKQRRKAQSAQAAQQAPAARPHAGKPARKRDAAADNTRPQVPTTRATDPSANPDPTKTQQRQTHKERQARKSANTDPTPERANTKVESPSATTAASEHARQPSSATHKPTARAQTVDVQKVKTKNANFRAQPKPQQVPAVTFNQSRQISGSEHWQGTQYTVFRSYRPQQHNQNWYHSHYPRIELIAGGYYFFNAGYWYPAWGYQPSAQYYVYDGPIYAGSRAEPPDRVIADVQAVLQEMGYYRGEVDGLLGPLTREALTAYQTDNGLYTTAAIDEPTLNALGI